MKNFTYHSQEEKENLEAILRRRKKKFNRQQITASIITAILIGVLALYFAFHVYYTEYDGYIHVDANQVRTPFDIYLDSVYVHEGDIVSPGDTLYSYFNINQLVEHFNINTEPAAISRYRDMTMHMAGLQEQVAVLRARVRELQSQIAVEDHNISFGLSSNSHKLDLQRELNVARVQLQALLQQLGIVNGLRSQSQPDYNRTASLNGSIRDHGAQIFDDANSALLYETKTYHLASDSSIITDISAPDRMVFFEKEEIMTTQHIDLEANNLMVVAYVPIDQMHRITRHSKAEVVVNSDFSFKAHVTVLGLRTEVIPDNLRSYFSKRNTAVIALLKIDEGQMVPFWTMADGIPVQVRVRNIDTWGEKPSGRNYLWYKTGEGLQTRLPDDWIYPGIVQDNDTATTDSKIKAKADSARRRQAQQPKPTRQEARPNNQEPQPKAQPTQQEPQPKAQQQPEPKRQETQAKPNSAGNCYIIAAAMSTEAGALKTRDHFRDKYPGAGMLQNGKKWLIYLSRTQTRQEAEDILLEVRKQRGLADAWILVKDSQD